MVRYTQQSAASKLSVPSEEVTVHNTNAKNSQITMLYILVMQYFRVRSDKGPVAYSTVIPQGSTAQLLYPMPKSSEKLRIFSEKLGYLWKFPKTLKTLCFEEFLLFSKSSEIFGNHGNHRTVVDLIGTVRKRSQELKTIGTNFENS